MAPQHDHKCIHFLMSDHIGSLPSDKLKITILKWIILDHYVSFQGLESSKTSLKAVQHVFLWPSQPLETFIVENSEFSHQGKSPVSNMLLTRQLCLHSLVHTKEQKMVRKQQQNQFKSLPGPCCTVHCPMRTLISPKTWLPTQDPPHS